MRRLRAFVLLVAAGAAAVVATVGTARAFALKVVDEKGAPVPRFEAMLHTLDQGYSRWIAGKGGAIDLDPFKNSAAVDVLLRAPGFTSASARFTDEQLEKLYRGETTMRLERGQTVNVRFRLPEGMEWPAGLVPEAYFNDFALRVRSMRMPNNRRVGGVPDFNMLNLATVGPGEFTFQATPAMPPFTLAIHSPGFLQYFEADSPRPADIKDAKLEIDVPRPAVLEGVFDYGDTALEKLPFGTATLKVVRLTPNSSSSYEVATVDRGLPVEPVKLSDLAPGDYLITVRTKEKPAIKDIDGCTANPGRFLGYSEGKLAAGESKRLTISYVPFDLNAFRGDRTAVLKFVRPNGSSGSARQVRINYIDAHYGELPVFSGLLPESGVLSLSGLTSQTPWGDDDIDNYSVSVNGESLDLFRLSAQDPEERFEFHLPPTVGDLVPNVELVDLSTGKSMAPTSLRGKVVCIDIWATWCGPCQPAMAKLNELVQQRAVLWQDRVAIVPISIDDTSEVVMPHLARRGWNKLTSYWTGEDKNVGWQSPAARAFGINGVPTSFLIGRDGRILWQGHPLDETDGQSLDTRLAAALGEMPPDKPAAAAPKKTSPDPAAEPKKRNSLNNIKQIMLAMHNYQDAKRTFPPAVISKNDQPLLSWRVAILPYLGEQALYEQFHLDEPWNSDHNKALIGKMPRQFRAPNSKLADGQTVYLTPRGEATAFPGAKGIPLRSILDGTSNTLALLEVEDGQGVIWTKPDDWKFDPANPCQKLIGQYAEGVHVGYCDGSARLLPATVDETVLQAVLTRAGKEQVDLPR